MLLVGAQCFAVDVISAASVYRGNVSGAAKQILRDILRGNPLQMIGKEAMEQIKQRPFIESANRSKSGTTRQQKSSNIRKTGLDVSAVCYFHDDNNKGDPIKRTLECVIRAVELVVNLEISTVE
jgi:hypothetical protein